jgi:predicted RecB family nuclease
MGWAYPPFHYPLTSYPLLTKSLFVSGHQCLKQLWWKVHDPDAKELEPDKVLQDLFDQGRQVGDIARRRIGDGVLIRREEREARLQVTRQAIADGASILYEGAFEADAVFVQADVLQRNGDGRWRLIEVKSSKSAKDEHIPDTGVQAHVLMRNGIELESVHVMHLNGEFRHPDIGDLFAQSDVTEAALAFAPQVPGIVRRQLEVLDGPLPEVNIGAHCEEPWECPFQERCFPNDDWHISTLFNCGPRTFPKFLARGISRIDQIPANEKLQFAQKRQISALKKGAMIVEPTLAKALEPFDVEPLGFLDFETILRAVPVWNGAGPWDQLPAQMSYHESLPGGGYRHEEFLAEGPEDCRPELARRLVEATRNAKRVVHYSPFERARIRALARTVPELARELGELDAKLIDLLPVVRDNVYHPAFRGSFSIKRVLPVLVPELSYDDLVIVDGRVASVEIARLLFVADRIPVEERDRVRKDLLDYCERDTWATVRLVERLRGMLTGETTR